MAYQLFTGGWLFLPGRSLIQTVNMTHFQATHHWADLHLAEFRVEVAIKKAVQNHHGTVLHKLLQGAVPVKGITKLTFVSLKKFTSVVVIASTPDPAGAGICLLTWVGLILVGSHPMKYATANRWENSGLLITYNEPGSISHINIYRFVYIYIITNPSTGYFAWLT